jgi:hypothetical protein
MQLVELRFWRKVDRRGDDECWPWLGGRTKTGYGRLRIVDGYEYAHRFAYRLIHGSIPQGKDVCHSCDNPPCCNPAHLWPGTSQENTLDSAKKGRWQLSHPYHAGVKGTAHYRAILTEDQVRAIRAAWIPYKVPLRTLAEKYGLSISGVAGIVYYRTWDWLPDAPIQDARALVEQAANSGTAMREMAGGQETKP